MSAESRAHEAGHREGGRSHGLTTSAYVRGVLADSLMVTA